MANRKKKYVKPIIMIILIVLIAILLIIILQRECVTTGGGASQTMGGGGTSGGCGTCPGGEPCDCPTCSSSNCDCDSCCPEYPEVYCDAIIDPTSQADCSFGSCDEGDCLFDSAYGECYCGRGGEDYEGDEDTCTEYCQSLRGTEYVGVCLNAPGYMDYKYPCYDNNQQYPTPYSYYLGSTAADDWCYATTAGTDEVYRSCCCYSTEY